MNLPEFIDTFADAIGDAVSRTYPPLYDFQARDTSPFDVRRLHRKPLGAQADAIRATALSLQRHPGTTVVGEMGVGKSYVAIAAAYLAGCRRVFLLTPPHLVHKWRREVLQTVPDAGVAIVRTIGDLERSRTLGGPMQVVICSREQAKLGYRWRPAALARPLLGADGRLARDDAGAVLRQWCCPDCCTPIVDGEEIPLSWDDLRVKRRRCQRCDNPLWQADPTGPRRVPLADYVSRRMPRHFDLLIGDEIHEFKARGSAQGMAAGTLAEACGRTLSLTGTLMGGHSSSLFYLLWRFSRTVRAEFSYRDEAKWVSRYGILERVSKKDADTYVDDGRVSRRRRYPVRVVEKPGVAPTVLLHLLDSTVFVRLADVAADLPSYTEMVQTCPLDRRGDALSQEACYRRLASDLRQAMLAALQRGSKHLLGVYLQALLAYPDACTREEAVHDPATGALLAQAPALRDDVLYPKEQALIDLVAADRARGRRTLVFITHTDRRDVAPRLASILERAGARVSVLKANTVAPDRREEWVAARVAEGANVLICHPRLVQTGLDLIAWASIIFYECDYSVYVMRQASRRSWRIGQQQPVEVRFLVYEETLQADALALVAAKLRSSLMIEGELPDDGLSALGGDGQDMLLALAKRVTEASGCTGESLEALFAQVRAVEEAANRGLTPEVCTQSSVTEDIRVVPSHGPDVMPILITPAPVHAEVRTERGITFGDLATFARHVSARRQRTSVGQLSLFDE